MSKCIILFFIWTGITQSEALPPNYFDSNQGSSSDSDSHPAIPGNSLMYRTPWHIKTKYYTTDVNLEVLTPDTWHLNLPYIKYSSEALILYWDAMIEVQMNIDNINVRMECFIFNFIMIYITVYANNFFIKCISTHYLISISFMVIIILISRKGKYC